MFTRNPRRLPRGNTSIISLALLLSSWSAIAQVQTSGHDHIDSAWKVFQRPYGCGISRSGTGILSAEPTFWWPFRGQATILLKFAKPNGDSISTGNLPGLLRLFGGPSVPVDVHWITEIDITRPDWPAQTITTVKIKDSSWASLRKSLSIAQRVELIARNRTIQIEFPSISTWQQASKCVQEAGEALLVAAPPPHGDGRPADRNLPVPRGASWINSKDYPLEALVAHSEGEVRIAISVDRYGYPIRCDVIESSRFKSLDDATCARSMKSAHFFPALNKAGVATDGKWEMTVKWRMP